MSLDPESHFRRYIDRAASQYVAGCERAGLQPSKRLTRAIAQRVAENAAADYEEQVRADFQRRTSRILSGYHARDRQIRREGARMAWMVCPFAVLAFSFLAWFKYHQGDPGTGLICGAGALAFLVMLVLAQWQGMRP